MTLGQLAGDGQAQARAATAHRADEWLEQVGAGALWHAGTVVRQAQDAVAGVAAQLDEDLALAAPVGCALDGLAGVAQQVGQDAMQLVGVGQHLLARADHGLQAHALRGQAGVLGGHVQGRAQRDDPRDGLGLLGLAVGHDVRGQVDSAVQGAFQAGKRLGHLGIAQRGQAVRRHLGAGQHVAQVVIDLGHRLAQGRQAGLGGQGRQQVGLHAVQLGLGAADLVSTLGDNDARLRVAGIAAEGFHGPRDPLHRPDEEDVQEGIDQQAGQGGDEDGHPGQAPEILDQRRLQGRVGHHHLDELGLAEARLGHHPDHAALGAGQGEERRGQP